MKQAAYILLIVSICSCATETDEATIHENVSVAQETQNEKSINNLQKDENPTEGDNSIIHLMDTLPDISELPNYTFDFVKSKTTLLTNEIKIDNTYLNKLNNMPIDFVKKYISTHKIDYGYPEYLPPIYPESYRFYQFKEYSNFNLFTFTHDNEYCCRTLYAATFSKDTLSVINIVTIGYSGGDGGWTGECYGEWMSAFGISTTTTSLYDENPSDDVNSLETDTTWSEIQLAESGVFKYIEHHRVKYVAGIQTE